MSADVWERELLEDGWQPCPVDKPCENCGHPMGGHFQPTTDRWKFDVACSACDCQCWRCLHGGGLWPDL